MVFSQETSFLSSTFIASQRAGGKAASTGVSSDQNTDFKGGWLRGRGHGRFKRPKLLCQICNKQGHLAFECYYRMETTFQKSYI